jgi:uncharacterized membrane protein YdjX (TVP38/TMEM64 family)
VYDAAVSTARVRVLLLVAWSIVVGGALWLFLFHRGAVQEQLQRATSVSMLAAGGLYLILGSLRGFSLVPVTSLVLVGVAFFPPVPLYLLTLAGIVLSSASVYLFASALHLDELIRLKQARRLERLVAALGRRQLPIIIGWSFFPLAPTDLICYVCGVLRISLAKCLLGVIIGEGSICAIYIAAGDAVLRWFALK